MAEEGVTVRLRAKDESQAAFASFQKGVASIGAEGQQTEGKLKGLQRGIAGFGGALGPVGGQITAMAGQLGQAAAAFGPLGIAITIAVTAATRAYAYFEEQQKATEKAAAALTKTLKEQRDTISQVQKLQAERRFGEAIEGADRDALSKIIAARRREYARAQSAMFSVYSAAGALAAEKNLEATKKALSEAEEAWKRLDAAADDARKKAEDARKKAEEEWGETIDVSYEDIGRGVKERVELAKKATADLLEFESSASERGRVRLGQRGAEDPIVAMLVAQEAAAQRSRDRIVAAARAGAQAYLDESWAIAEAEAAILDAREERMSAFGRAVSENWAFMSESSRTVVEAMDADLSRLGESFARSLGEQAVGALESLIAADRASSAAARASAGERVAAVLAAVQGTLAAVGVEASVKALFALAEGFMGHPGAFAAAGYYAATATAAGLAAGAIGATRGRTAGENAGRGGASGSGVTGVDAGVNRVNDRERDREPVVWKIVVNTEGVNSDGEAEYIAARVERAEQLGMIRMVRG